MATSTTRERPAVAGHRGRTTTDRAAGGQRWPWTRRRHGSLRVTGPVLPVSPASPGPPARPERGQGPATDGRRPDQRTGGPEAGGNDARVP